MRIIALTIVEPLLLLRIRETDMSPLKILFALLLSAMVILGVWLISQDRTIDTPYQYPIMPGSAEWAQLESRTEMVKRCQIPQNILRRLSTDALLQTILDYPLLFEMRILYWNNNESDKELGFRHIADTFNGLQEFMRRDDALQTLNKYGSFKDLDNNSNILTIIYRNVLSTQKSC